MKNIIFSLVCLFLIIGCDEKPTPKPPLAPLYVIKVEYIGEVFDQQLEIEGEARPFSKMYLVTLGNGETSDSQITFKTKTPSSYPLMGLILN
jgi:hypothetical protein